MSSDLNEARVLIHCCLIKEKFHECITLVSGLSCHINFCVTFLAEYMVIQDVFSL